MIQLDWHPEARIENLEARAFYIGRSWRVADDYLYEINSGLDKIQQHPNRYPSYLHNTQRLVLQYFPFSIIYRQQLNAIQIIAIAHAKRRPGYWASRS